MPVHGMRCIPYRASTAQRDLISAYIGVIRTLKFPAIKGKARMTAKEFVGQFPRGNYILKQAHHVVGVKGGVVFDKFDSTGRCVYQAWEIAR